MMRLVFAVLAAGLACAGVLAQAQSPGDQPAAPPAVVEPAPPPPPAVTPPPVVTPPPALVPPPAPLSQTPSPGAAEDGRYAFHRMQDNFVRLDTRTGQVSICGHGPSGWTCKTMPDERTALESEIGRLQGNNAALKKELLAHNLELPSGVRADPAPQVAKKGDKLDDKKGGTAPSVQMPSEADLDRVMGFVEKVWRRMVEMMMSIQRDIQQRKS